MEEKNLQLEDTKRQLEQSKVELGKFRKSIFGFYKKDECGRQGKGIALGE